MLKGKKVAITGGTGFIGSRLAEKLILEYGAEVSILLERYTNASRVARLPVQFKKVDLLDKNNLKEILQDCNYVVHCAYGSRGTPQEQYEINVNGTRTIAEIAAACGVNRFIHLSTVMVYGTPQSGVITEDLPYTETDNPYAAEKIASEKIVKECHKNFNLPYVILQPTAVIGPDGLTWTKKIFERLKKKRIILINGGDGLCNFIYIDDCVDGIIRALQHENAIGETFLLSADSPVSWKDFYSAHEAMLGISSTIDLNVKEAKRLYDTKDKERNIVYRGISAVMKDRRVKRRANKYLQNRIIYGIASVLFQKYTLNEYTNLNGSNNIKHKEIHYLDQDQISFFSSKAIVSSKKAKDILGIKNRYDFEDVLNPISSWAMWTRII